MRMAPLLGRIAQLAERATQLEQLLADPAVIANQAEYRKHAKEYGFASRAAALHRTIQSLERRRREAPCASIGRPAREPGHRPPFLTSTSIANQLKTNERLLAYAR